MSDALPFLQQPRKFVLEFTKMSGAGNDFIVIDNRFYRFTADELSGFALRWCARRTGVGADGLLALCLPESEDAHYRMAYYNADGSLGTMCGNGARCLARFAVDAGIEGDPLLFDSDAGLYRASVQDDSVRLFVPPPERYSASVDLQSTSERPATIWTGTEHAVVFVDDVDSTDVSGIGNAIRSDVALAPAGANVNFVQVVSEDTLRVRTFEKGVEAETLACGTGSIASSIVAARTRALGHSRFEVHMPGGVLHVGFNGSAEAPTDLYLEGPAEEIYRGTVSF